jgi:segregation and condensation protein A
VEKDEIDMELKMAYVEAYLESNKEFSFVELLERQKSKMEIIVTFLVILELMKIGRITISQDDFKDDIIIKRHQQGS